MRHTTLLVLLLAGACSSPDDLGLDQACGPNGQCPTSYTCNAIDNRCYVNGSFSAVEVNIVVVGDGKVTVGATQKACDDICRYTAARGKPLGLVAAPGQGAELTGWSGECSGTSPRTTITPSESMTCTATFATRRDGKLTLGVPGGGGRITGDASCQAPSCEVPARAADELALEAVADAGHRFTGWSGDGACASATTAKITVPAATTTRCLASFVARFRVAGQASGATASIAAASSAPFAQCAGAACVVDAGRAVELSAPTVDGFRLASWSGAGCSGSGPVVTVTAAADTTCTATYARGVAVLASVVGAPAAVTATSTSPGAVCKEGGCVLDTGGTVTLSVPEVAGYRWISWTGDTRCKGTSRTLLLDNVTTSVSCAARFVRRVTVAGKVSGATGAVAASSTAEAGSCSGASCVVDAGAKVSLEAPALTGFVFSSWSGGTGCSGAANPLIITAAEDTTCTAAFLPSRVTVAGAVSGATGSVTASSTSAGATCAGASCSVVPPADVTLVAPDLTGSRFTGWSGGAGCAGSERTLKLLAVTATTTCTAGYVRRIVVGATVSGATGTVTASSSSTGATCGGGKCTVDAGAPVTLLAPPLAGVTFRGWSGGTGCSGSTNPLTIITTADTTCVASYAAACWEGCYGKCEGAVCWINDVLTIDGQNAYFSRQGHDSKGNPTGGARVMRAPLATAGAGTLVTTTDKPVTALLSWGSYLYVMTEGGTSRIQTETGAAQSIFDGASAGQDITLEQSTQSNMFWLVPGDGIYTATTGQPNTPARRVTHAGGDRPFGLTGGYETLYWLDGGVLKSMYIWGTVPSTLTDFDTLDEPHHVSLQLYSSSVYWLLPGGTLYIYNAQIPMKAFTVSTAPVDIPMALDRTGIYWPYEARTGAPSNIMRMPIEGGDEAVYLKDVVVQDLKVGAGTIYVLGPNVLTRFAPVN